MSRAERDRLRAEYDASTDPDERRALLGAMREIDRELPDEESLRGALWVEDRIPSLDERLAIAAMVAPPGVKP